MVIAFDVLAVDARGFYPTCQAAIMDQRHVLFSELRGAAMLNNQSEDYRGTSGGLVEGWGLCLAHLIDLNGITPLKVQLITHLSR